MWPLPLFALVNTGSTGLALLAFSVAAVVQGIMAGAQGGLFTEIFDVRVRYSGISVAYQLGGMIGGAVTPLAATALFGAFGSSTPIALYVTALCLLSLVAAALIRVPVADGGRRDRGPADRSGDRVMAGRAWLRGRVGTG